MNAINLVLIFKIAITIGLLAVPFLLLPKQRLEKFVRLSGESAILFRLYGMAMLALAVAYLGGVWTVQQGIFPWTVVLMGLVSNGGATVLLLLLGDRKSKRFIAPVFGGIAIGLFLCALHPATAMTSFSIGGMLG